MSKSAQDKMRQKKKEEKEQNHREHQEMKELEEKEQNPWEQLKHSGPEKMASESMWVFLMSWCGGLGSVS